MLQKSSAIAWCMTWDIGWPIEGLEIGQPGFKTDKVTDAKIKIYISVAAGGESAIY